MGSSKRSMRLGSEAAFTWTELLVCLFVLGVLAVYFLRAKDVTNYNLIGTYAPLCK